MDGKERIVLGSGKLYVTEFTNEIPENDVLETEENRIGYIKGGATLEYKPEFYEAKDDLGYVTKKALTGETVTFKSGIMTWNMAKLMKLCNTGRKVGSKGDINIYKIGGIGNYDGKSYVIHFVHEDVDGDLRVSVVGTNQAGFTLSFVKNQETIADAEFIAEPHDSDGTLVVLQEDVSAPTTDSYLASLAVGTLNLNPAFSVNNTNYEVSTTDDDNLIIAVARDPEAVIGIKVNDVEHTNGTEATWDTGINTVKITVNDVKTYTITVTKQ